MFDPQPDYGRWIGWTAVVTFVVGSISMAVSTPEGMVLDAAGALAVMILALCWLRVLKPRGRKTALVIALVGLLAAAGMVGAAVHTWHVKDRAQQSHRAPKPKHRDKPASPASPPQPAPAPSPPVAPVTDLTRTWEQVCESRPGARAPKWAAPLLNALYLGGLGGDADPPPGASAGCTGVATSPPGMEGRFVYATGTDAAGRAKSVAVVSKDYPPALFLAPAVTPVLALIDKYGNIGGSRRIPAGDGDAYEVRTPKGSAALVRKGTMRDDGSGLAEPYVTLVPAAATLWFQAMTSRGAWLWPLAGEAEDGRVRIDLVPDLLTNTPVATILVDPDTDRARLDGDSSWGGSSGIRISAADLEALAP